MISPVVRRFPTIVRSDDSVDAGGFGFGADGVKSDAARCGGAIGAFGVSSALGPGSFILLLENISGCLDVSHRVDGLAANSDLVVKVGAGRTASVSHITDPLSARDPLADFHANF